MSVPPSDPPVQPTDKEELRKRWLIGVSSAIVIGFIIFAALVLVPRHISVNPTRIDTDKISFRNGTIFVPLIVSVRGTNDNFYDITLRDVTIKGTHPAYPDTLVSVAPNNTTPIWFLAARSVDVPLQDAHIVFTWNYRVDKDQMYLRQAQRNCTADDGTLWLSLDIGANYETFIKNGHESMQQTLTFPCRDLLNSGTMAAIMFL